MPEPYRVKPDRDFLHRILDEGGEDLKKCFQCATCSVVCELSNGEKPFPRKEMIWAQWGLKDRLVADPDVWLCHQCSDCSTKCPRGARPGDVLAALRQQAVEHFAVPRFLGKWVNQAKYFPLLLAVPVVLLGLLVVAPLEDGPEISGQQPIVYACWAELPHWVLMSFFGVFSALALLAVIVGVVRFWGAMEAADGRSGDITPAKSVLPCIGSALKSILAHEKFTMCTTDRWRYVAHFAVFYGFLALLMVAIWVVIVVLTGGQNPLVRGGFAYPFNFWNPWRMLANLGGVALVAGCLLMIWERLKKNEQGGASSYCDWAFLGILLVVALTGLAAETLHYARMEPHRQIAYFIHLVSVFMLLMYLPYSKFAHLAYRTAAMVYAEYSGRNSAAPATAAEPQREDQTEEQEQAEKANE